jgi:transposase
VVQHYLDGAVGFNKVAQHYGLSAPAVRSWVERYRLHGNDGLSQSGRGHYTLEFKLSVLQHMWDNGLSYRQTAAAFNLSSSSRIGDWERRFQSGGAGNLGRSPRRNNGVMKTPTTPSTSPTPGEDNRTREQLLEELEWLRMENDYLKKLKALVDAKSAAAKKRK